MPIYAIRVVTGREQNVANHLYRLIKARDLPIKTILAPQELKGYIFIEADQPTIIDRLIYGKKHIRGRLPDPIPFSEIEHYLVKELPKLAQGDIVTILAGPLKDYLGTVQTVSEKEVTVILRDVAFTEPITLPLSYVKKVKL